MNISHNSIHVYMYTCTFTLYFILDFKLVPIGEGMDSGWLLKLFDCKSHFLAIHNGLKFS